MSISDSTATMMVAARVARGRWVSRGVSSSVAPPMPSAVKAPAAGVAAPASALTTEREKPPVTGMPPEKAAPRLAVPSPASSWSGSMRSRRRAASVSATEMDSTNPTMLISSAATPSSRQSPTSMDGRVRGGRPDGIAPTTATP